MKKIIFTVIIALVLLGSCQTGDVKDDSTKYADAKVTIERMIRLFDDFATFINAADDTESMVVAINKFTDDYTILIPELEEMDEKYPELGDILDEGATVPDELNDVIAKWNVLMQNLVETQAKIESYKDDPKVTEALDKLNEQNL